MNVREYISAFRWARRVILEELENPRRNEQKAEIAYDPKQSLGVPATDITPGQWCVNVWLGIVVTDDGESMLSLYHSPYGWIPVIAYNQEAANELAEQLRAMPIFQMPGERVVIRQYVQAFEDDDGDELVIRE